MKIKSSAQSPISLEKEEEEIRKIVRFKVIVLECAKTRKYSKPDPTRIFRVSSGVTWETWNFVKWNPARPWPEFSGSGFFPGFRVPHVGHPTNTQQQKAAEKFREIWKAEESDVFFLASELLRA